VRPPNPPADELGAIRATRLRSRHGPGECLGAQFEAVEEARDPTRHALGRFNRVQQHLGRGLDRPRHGIGRSLEELRALARLVELCDGAQLANANAQQLPTMRLKGPDVGADGELSEHLYDGHLGIDRKRWPLKEIGRRQLARLENRWRFEARLGLCDHAQRTTLPEKRRGKRQRGSDA
jgi:hypothetical protein